MNDLDLPPRRALPREVRTRLRTTLDRRIDTPRPARFRGPLAAAAGVAVLVAGAVIITQSVHGTPDDFQPGIVPPTSATTPSPEPGPDPAAMGAALDRCAAAVANDGLPPREQWQPVVGASGPDVIVVMARVGGEPVACQTTATSVTVAAGSGAVPLVPGSRAGVMLNSPQGVVAGVTDPPWGRVGAHVMDRESTTTMPAESRDGLFALVRDPSVGAAVVRLYEMVGDNADPPAWEESAETGTSARPTIVVDRPGTVAPADEELFDACLGATPSWARDGWGPGASLRWNHDGRVLLVRAGDQVGVCRRQVKPANGREYTLTALETAPTQGFTPCWLTGVTPDDDPTPPLVAVVDPTPPLAAVVSPEAAYVDVHFANYYRESRVAVVNGTFVTQPPQAGLTVEKVDVYDADGELRHSGPLTC